MFVDKERSTPKILNPKAFVQPHLLSPSVREQGVVGSRGAVPVPLLLVAVVVAAVVVLHRPVELVLRGAVRRLLRKKRSGSLISTYNIVIITVLVNLTICLSGPDRTGNFPL